MDIKFRGRVIDLYVSADAKYPGTSVTFSDVVAGGQLKLKFNPDLARRIKLDGLYDVAGGVKAQLAQQAFGAVRLDLASDASIVEVKDK